jgi:hypothetical protein
MFLVSVQPTWAQNAPDPSAPDSANDPASGKNGDQAQADQDQAANDSQQTKDSTSKKRTSRISDDVIPLIELDDFPKRPKPILELGDPFLGSGNIQDGILLPTGAVWQPSFLVYGTYRSALQVYDPGDGGAFSEWSNRLDIFGNVQLSGTERILVGISPLSQDGRFTGYNFNPANDPSGDRGFEDEYNLEITTLFFEGDFGEIFPGLDPQDTRSTDWGFSVGRQPLSYQDGMLISDTIDSVGITRNTLLPHNGSDMQITFLYGWNEINRDDNLEDDDTHLFALFTSADLPTSTVNLDAVWIYDEESDTDGLYWGVSSVQRMGHINTTFRLLGSHALEEESAAVSTGLLFFTQLTTTPAWTHDVLYVNGFVGIDNFASAARGPATGGPLGQTGILFAAVGLGRYGAALGSRADESFGGALGYQAFIGEELDSRRQLIFEVGARSGTTGADDVAVAGGVRFLQALGQHWVVQVDLFGTLQEGIEDAYGTRVELRLEF